jgi:hypothetical protein
MARRLFPALYALAEGDATPRPFLDILNRLEQLGAIPQASDWQYFRNLRNNLAHDYPDSIDQTVATLNELFDNWRALKRIFQAARDFYHALPAEH